MSDPIVWPKCMLNPRATAANPVAFTRGGGRSLGGIERAVRTDLGYWSIELNDILIRSRDQKRTWNAIRTELGGRAGLCIIPVKSWDTAPYGASTQDGQSEYAAVETVHNDQTPHSDGTPYSQQSIEITAATSAAVGATTIRLRGQYYGGNLSGVRFSYNHALYETGAVIDQTGKDWTVRIFPSVRATIPSGAVLEFENPTCLVHLADDRGMDLPEGHRPWQEASVAFVEAVEVWNDLLAP